MTSPEDQARAFYAARDRRTFQYGATEAALSRPLSLSIQPGPAGTSGGRVALLALVDMLFRVHRNIRLDLPQTNTTVGDRLEKPIALQRDADNVHKNALPCMDPPPAAPWLRPARARCIDRSETRRT